MIHFKDVGKIYPQGKAALQNITFSIEKGEFVYLTGHSGAGKSTLLKIIAAMEKISSGEVIFNNESVSNLKHNQIPFFRRKIGVIFQDHHLMINRTVAENVALPLLIQNMDEEYIYSCVHKTLKKINLEKRINDYPSYLSAGEQQRVGIARALVNEPLVILADEPTGNLDNNLSLEIMNIFDDLQKSGVTVVVATHNLQLIEKIPHRNIVLQEGRIITDSKMKE